MNCLKFQQDQNAGPMKQFLKTLLQFFLIHELFFNTAIRCPWCRKIVHLKIHRGNRDDRYHCSYCSKYFSVDWVDNSVTQLAEHVQTGAICWVRHEGSEITELVEFLAS